MPTVPAARDINLHRVVEGIQYGFSGEWCASFELSPRLDVRMISSDQVPSYVDGFSRLLQGIPVGYGLMFESEVVPASDAAGDVPEDIHPVIRELSRAKIDQVRSMGRRLRTLAHVWSSPWDPLRLPMLPALTPQRKDSVPASAETMKEIIQNITTSLEGIGVKSKMMDTPAVLKRYWSILNPGKPSESPLITGRHSLRSELCASNSVETQETYAVNGVHHVGVTFYNYGDSLRLGGLDSLLEVLPMGSRFVQVIMVPGQESYLNKLKLEYRRAENFMKESVSKDFESEARFKDLDEIVTRCREDGERVYSSWAGVILRGEDKKNVLDQSKRLVSDIRESLNTEAVVENLIHRRTFFAALPMNGHLSPRRNVMLGSTLSATTPLSQPWRGCDKGMVLFGRADDPLMFDLFDGGSTRHGIVAAIKGGGKSFTANMMILAALRDPKTRVLVIDKGGSYRRLAEIVGGSYFDIKIDENFAINVLAPRKTLLRADGSFDPEDLADQTSLVMRFLPKIASGSTRLVVEKTLERVYRRLEEPLLSDFYDELKKGEWDKGLTATVESVAAEIRVYVETVYANLFSRPTNIRPFQSPLTVFDLKGLDQHKHLQGILVGVISYSLSKQLNDKSIPKVIVIDEGWELFEDPDAGNFVRTIYRQARKQNGAIFSISQSISDFINSPIAEDIKATIDWVMVLKTATDHDKLSFLNITDQAIEESKQLKVVPKSYAEVLIRFDNNPPRVVRVVPTALEYWMATTNPEETTRELKNRQENGFTTLESIRDMAKKEPMIPW